jgi:hypothetical protein
MSALSDEKAAATSGAARGGYNPVQFAFIREVSFLAPYLISTTPRSCMCVCVFSFDCKN